MDVAAAEAPGSGRSAEAAAPLQPVLIVLLVTSALCSLALLLARAFTWPASGRPPAFEYLFLRNEPAAAWLSCAIILGAALAATAMRSLPERMFVARLTRDPRAFIACVTAGLIACALLVYRGHPLSMDEYAPVFQARIFARGALVARVPPELVQRLIPAIRWFIEASPDGRLVSAYWPGFALLLTPFVWLGAPWLLNPLVGGATLLVIWHIGRRLWPDTGAAGWAVLLTAASPAFVVNAISLYSMPAHLLGSLCFFALLLDPTPRRLFLAGAVGSLALTLHNPVPHTTFALPLIVVLAVRPGRIGKLAALAAGYLPGLAMLGAGWFWVRAQIGGNAETAAGGAGALSVLSRLAFALPSASSLWSRSVNVAELALWAVPGLLALACIGAIWRRSEPSVRLLTASALLTAVAYVFVPYDQGHGWGYRYFHAAWGVLPLLAAGALEHPRAVVPLRRTALIAALASLLLGNGLRLGQARSFIDAHLAQIPEVAGAHLQQVVFVDASRGSYAIDLVQNDPFLESEKWILISHGDAPDARFMRAFFPRARRAATGPVASVWVIE